jgi:hypothetical protein
LLIITPTNLKIAAHFRRFSTPSKSTSD